MRKLILTAVLALGAFSLIGCHNKVIEPEQPLRPMQQSFMGVLPCADCSGIETSLFLQEDGTYVLNQHYQGTPGKEFSRADYGTWARTADKLVLTDKQGGKRYFHPNGENLDMLDVDGNAIKSSFNYQLKPVQQSMPKTPMALSGMLQFNTDKASFIDCTTGKLIPVAVNVQLHQEYVKAQSTPNQLIFVSMDGHFTVEPSDDDRQWQKALVVDGQIAFDQRKNCDSK
ncbi:envelope stress response activation lipoprotein NlpE [Rouxiella sp. Mn2063]|uniref:envelope stress response activation lipoprotein NlpE n=1 Tax=Rouxiella sp. Mn2063 TaxID=3395262 RepID=UPI003BDE97BD